MGRSFRELGAWRYGMELLVLVFDLTVRFPDADAGDSLRLDALEVPQRIASGAMDGRPRQWAQGLRQARAALDRVEEAVGRFPELQDPRLLLLIPKVRRELNGLYQEALQLGAGRADGPAEGVLVAA